ncbi:MAG: DUF2029 domain-containing protein [Deltaproteobacteria bacterium]|nr:DUF2029 domain-containing protein [Deltaproteobacteria bacterium]
MLHTILNASTPPSRSARALFILASIALALQALAFSLESLKPELINRKDLLQDYLSARAVMKGENPYSPTTILAAQLMTDARADTFPHPTPHTPFVVAATTPLGLLSYDQAAIVWMVLELVALGAAAIVLQRLAGHSSLGYSTLVLFLFLLGSRSAKLSLLSGQFSLFILLFAALCLNELAAGRERRAGIYLGLALATKLWGGPLVLGLLLARRYPAAIAALVTAIAAQLVAIPLIGWDAFREYVSTVAPSVAQHYRADPQNQSLWTLATRFFDGVRSPATGDSTAAIMSYAPDLIPLGNMIIVGGALIAALLVVRRARDFNAAASMLVVLSSLLSPIAWVHGFAVSAAACVELWRRAASPRAAAGLYLLMVALIGWTYIGDTTAVVSSEKSLELMSPMLSQIALTIALGVFALRPSPQRGTAVLP